MELSEVIFDLKIKGSRSHINYDTMVNNWYIEENNPIPSLELCEQIWNEISLIRLREQRKLERILEVKGKANEILRLNYDWKVSKQYTTNYWTNEQFELIKQEMQNIRDKSNEIETQINDLDTLDDVNNFVISID